jgi:hypothetical protein
VTRSIATTLAARGSKRMSAISPKASPGSICPSVSSTPSTVRKARQWPATIMYASSPLSPSRTMISPGAKLLRGR